MRRPKGSSKVGSSPRMRGALQPLGYLKFVPRIIPADAGSTSPRPAPAIPGTDHPRGCGEHTIVENNGRSYQGSSPRMRGALVGQACRDPLEGIIPADAGSTNGRCRCRHRKWDHPRGCGEHKDTSFP